jgi:hypothetical protein
MKEKKLNKLKNIMVLQFTSRRGLHTKDHDPDRLGGYIQQKYHES